MRKMRKELSRTVLWCLERNTFTITEISEQFGISVSAVAGQVRTLKSLHLVEHVTTEGWDTPTATKSATKTGRTHWQARN